MIKVYQVDSFSSKAFGGNPAAVCVVKSMPTSKLMTQIAAEMNLSETAFVASRPGETSTFDLKWFTPTTEVPLCGHATLATAAVLFYDEDCIDGDVIVFKTLSGDLICHRGSRDEGMRTVRMNFPLNTPTRLIDRDVPRDLLRTISVPESKIISVEYSDTTKKLLCLLDISRSELMNLKPDINRMLEVKHTNIEVRGLILTIPGIDNTEYDCHSRYFAPWVGIPEDPVTGSAHTVLGPFWGLRLKKTHIRAEQCSLRGGSLDLRINHSSNRIDITGETALVMSGQILLPTTQHSRL